MTHQTNERFNFSINIKTRPFTKGADVKLDHGEVDLSGDMDDWKKTLRQRETFHQIYPAFRVICGIS